jgi:hypothetical protein
VEPGYEGNLMGEHGGETASKNVADRRREHAVDVG